MIVFLDRLRHGARVTCLVPDNILNAFVKSDVAFWADVPGKRKRGRPKTRWKDACQRYLKGTGLRAGEETDRAMWRRKIISYRPTGDPT